MLETKNAIIESATITNDDHGLLSAWVHLDYGGSGQGFGGFALYLPKAFTHGGLTHPNFAGHFIWRVMEVAGVSRWDQLKGKTIRAKCEHARVESIGHIVKEDWFNPTRDFDRARPPAAAVDRIDNGNIAVFCDYVDQPSPSSPYRGCVRGAGHNGPHAMTIKLPTLSPVMLVRAALAAPREDQ